MQHIWVKEQEPAIRDLTSIKVTLANNAINAINKARNITNPQLKPHPGHIKITDKDRCNDPSGPADKPTKAEHQEHQWNHQRVQEIVRKTQEDLQEINHQEETVLGVYPRNTDGYGKNQEVADTHTEWDGGVAIEELNHEGWYYYCHW